MQPKRSEAIGINLPGKCTTDIITKIGTLLDEAFMIHIIPYYRVSTFQLTKYAPKNALQS